MEDEILNYLREECEMCEKIKRAIDSGIFVELSYEQCILHTQVEIFNKLREIENNQHYSTEELRR